MSETAGRQDDSRSLELLLADYGQCRDDERAWITLIASLIAIAMSLIGVITGAVTESCAFSTSSSCVHVPDAVVAGAPLLPFGLIALGEMYGMVATIRSFYMRRLEQEIRATTLKSGGGVPEIVPFNYIGLTTQIQSLRRGHPAYLWLSTIVDLIGLVGLAGLAVYIGLHMDPVTQAVMILVYAPIAGILLYEIYVTGPQGRLFYERTAARLRRNLISGKYDVGDPPPAAVPGGARPRSLLSYLLFPRPYEVAKLLLMPIAFAVAAWASGTFSRWQDLIFTWIIFEYLIYQARYQVNDIRGVSGEAGSPAKLMRGRLPMADGPRTAIAASLAMVFFRILLAVLLAHILNLLTEVTILIGATAAATVIYEILRAIRPRKKPLTAAVSAAVWISVGFGYAIRSSAGIWLADHSLLTAGSALTVLFFVAYGIKIALQTWVLEAATYCTSDATGNLYLREPIAAKPHIDALLVWTGWTVHRDPGAQGPVHGGEVAVMSRNRAKKPLAPWNLAFCLGAIAGAIATVALTQPSAPHWLYGTTAVLSLAASGLMVVASNRCHLVITVVTAPLLAGMTLSVTRQATAVIVALPWLAIALDYGSYCATTYEGMLKALPKAVKALEKITGQVAVLILTPLLGKGAMQYLLGADDRTP